MEISFGQDKKKLQEKKHQDELLLNELSLSLKNIDKRYFTVQNNFHNIGLDIDNRNEIWDDEIIEFTNQLDEIKKDMINLQNRASESIVLMKKIIVRFKNSSKKDDYDKVFLRLNDWKLENYITKDRFRKVLLEEIEKRL